MGCDMQECCVYIYIFSLLILFSVVGPMAESCRGLLAARALCLFCVHCSQVGDHGREQAIKRRCGNAKSQEFHFN